MRAWCVIPARYGSERFPGKALADLCGAPLVVRVAQVAVGSGLFESVVVATDDERIAAAVAAARLNAALTSPEHRSGTDRVAEVAARLGLGPRDVVVNLQGDEPFVSPVSLRELLGAFADEAVSLATLAHLETDRAQIADPSVVKVVVDSRGDALYFSRAPIPGTRSGSQPSEVLRHIGVYAFRREALERFVALPRGRLEEREGLEQLRALEAGMRIRVVLTAHPSFGVDTPEQMEEARRRWSQMEGGR